MSSSYQAVDQKTNSVGSGGLDLASATDAAGAAVGSSPPAPCTYVRCTWWRLIVAWQCAAILLTGTGAFAQAAADRGADIPTTQSFLCYLALSLYCIPLYWRQRQSREYRSRTASIAHAQQNDITNFAASANDEESGGVTVSASTNSVPASGAPEHKFGPFRIHIAWWQYALLALCDVEGNFCLVYAYQYTTIASVQLLDCFTIPVVMILSRVVLKTRFNRKHVFGCIICVIGLGLLVASDFISDRHNTSGGGGGGGHNATALAVDSASFTPALLREALGSSSTTLGDTTSSPSTRDAVRGDVLVLIGTICYSISNIGQEHVVKTFDWVEFLAMYGVWGSLWSGLQMIIVERHQLATMDWTDGLIWTYLIGFDICLFSLYTIVPLLLQHSSAVFMNLSFLTADFWSLLIAMFVFSAQLHILYFIAFGVIIAGLVLYNLANTPVCSRYCSFLSSPESAEHETLSRENSAHALIGGGTAVEPSPPRGLALASSSASASASASGSSAARATGTSGIAAGILVAADEEAATDDELNLVARATARAARQSLSGGIASARAHLQDSETGSVGSTDSRL